MRCRAHRKAAVATTSNDNLRGTPDGKKSIYKGAACYIHGPEKEILHIIEHNKQVTLRILHCF